MPNIKSAKKRMELTHTARAKNRAERSRVRTAVKRVREATTAEEAQARYAEAQALLDRAATRGLHSANAVARWKSSLQRHVSSLSA
ncbi:MAG: 30S ribosomal protein S20 [Gemmatimonadetes bacterium]|jgi:small subunit ribosomal protein S20|nr:30S ribosomal protein S20 [Gemmatimonadota bacterium]